jgi:hypothetical protein
MSEHYDDIVITASGDLSRAPDRPIENVARVDLLVELDASIKRARAARDAGGEACAEHWHCDPDKAAHRCEEPNRALNCPACDAGPAPVPTPALDAMALVKARRVDPTGELGEFLEWLADKGLRICQMGERRPGVSQLIEVPEGPQKLMAIFYGLDLKAIDREQRALLRRVRDEDRARREIDL